MNLLEVRNLKVHFPVKHGVFSPVLDREVDFEVADFQQVHAATLTDICPRVRLLSQ